MIIKILLDECLPKKLKYRIEELDPDFVTDTVPEMNWDSYLDGNLLAEAENEFDVFITSNRNLSFQQPIHSTKIHVVLLKAYTNTYEDLLPLVEKLTPIIKAKNRGSLAKSSSQLTLTKRFKGDRLYRQLLAPRFIPKITLSNNLRYSACTSSAGPLWTSLFLILDSIYSFLLYFVTAPIKLSYEPK